MSFSGLLAHRVTIKRQRETNVNGTSVYRWEVVRTNVKCFLDLNFIRRGKDPQWTPEAGRSADRQGVAFFQSSAPIQNADRIEVTLGPKGTFTLDMAVDEAWRPKRMHHYEVFVKEVPSQIHKGQKE